jgi:hypothetical protein
VQRPDACLPRKRDERKSEGTEVVYTDIEVGR